MIHLTLDELLHVGERTPGGEVEVHDHGCSSRLSPSWRTTAFGVETHPTVVEKGAALLHSLARTRGLVDGNKLLALATTSTSLGVNGVRLTSSNTEAYVVVMAVAAGELDDVPNNAKRPQDGTGPW